MAVEQASLDEAELREIEHADYYPAVPAAPDPVGPPAAAPRTFLDRLFQRSSR